MAPIGHRFPPLIPQLNITPLYPAANLRSVQRWVLGARITDLEISFLVWKEIATAVLRQRYVAQKQRRDPLRGGQTSL